MIIRARRCWLYVGLGLVAALVGMDVAFGDATSGQSSLIAQVDLAKPFKTRSAWRLVVTQGPSAVDYGGDAAPGALLLCLEASAAGPCTSTPAPMPPPQSGSSYDGWEPHYLRIVKPVYPNGASAPPLLLIVTASMHAFDGGQLVVTQLLKYDWISDKFERVYARSTGSNNNQEVRFISSGPLEGSVISATPTDNAPFDYWIEVDRLRHGRAYRPVLRYRSATHYNDGNSLAVIDSEMPNIERRLGAWRPGSPLPLPKDTRCPAPHLVHGELWCK